MPDVLRLMPEAWPRGPRLAVVWQTRWQNFAGSLHALLSPPKAPRTFPSNAYLRDCWVRAAAPWFREAHKPKRSLLLSVLCHIALFTLPLPIWKAAGASEQLAMPRIEVTWYGPTRDLPVLNPTGPASKPSPPGEPDEPLPRRGADGFHPRQTIISAPKAPTHPRQTLIQPDAPNVAPQILPQLPNIVEWAEQKQPVKPRLQISQADLAKLRPKKQRMRHFTDVPVPEVPNAEKQVGELNIASSPENTAHPVLPVTPTAAPRVGPRPEGQEASAAPDLGPNLGSDNTVQRLIALSATPGPAAPNVLVPAGNLEARVSISPEGAQPGSPGGSPNGVPGVTGGAGASGGSGGTQSGTGGGGKGTGPEGISISGGDPNHTANIAGLGGSGSSGSGSGGNSAPPHALLAKPEPRAPSPDPVKPAPAPALESIKPGAPPEQIFGPKRIYTIHVNMPNLASVTGSWVLSFVELNTGDPPPPGMPRVAAGDLSGPVPLRKVDPRYPPALASAKVEGEVVLYAIIRKDGSVDSIQVVRGLDPQLDRNAMEAMARWKFRPAERQGAPVELEAIVHIPFKAVAPLY